MCLQTLSVFFIPYGSYNCIRPVYTMCKEFAWSYTMDTNIVYGPYNCIRPV
ncbi:hypothetical protein HanXRQr2_Chr07g0286451 [Helianthus annuus]|uniref:Uncharacterized protein n=1 Tax=Helianthus annuus TaxID=4232 RepID=A0A9K3IJA3_HELAN|nr:hypothetical protein HanXRQr2_Chr07g0286451 [Helianthus annuus]